MSLKKKKCLSCSGCQDTGENHQMHDAGERRDTRLLEKELLTPFQNCREGHFVGLSFRCWMRGLQSRDLRYFEICSRYYVECFGMPKGIVLSGLLGNWARAVHKKTIKPIQINPCSAPGLNFDEVMAVSMIAAHQHGQCPAMKACLFALMGAIDMSRVEKETENLATELSDSGVILSPDFIAAPLLSLESSPATGMIH